MSDAAAKNADSTSAAATTAGGSDEQWLTPAELALLMRVGKRTVEDRARSGQWPHHRVGRSVRFDPDDVKAIRKLTAQHATSKPNPWGLTEKSRQAGKAAS